MTMAQSVALVFVAAVAAASASPLSVVGVPQELSEVITEAGGMPTSLPRANPFVCNDQRLKACENKFNKDIGAEGNLDWKYPNALAYVISKLTTSGREGLVSACHARQRFQECLGASYYSCLNPLYFLKHGASFGNAYTYIGIFQSLQWHCIQGFTEGVENWPCIVNTMQTADKTLSDCVQAWNTTVYGDMSKYCSAGKTLTQCYSAPFKAQCSYNGEAAWWACNNISFGFLLEHCHIACPVGGARTMTTTASSAVH